MNQTSKRSIAILSILILVLLLLDGYALNRTMVETRGHLFDFYPRWKGVQIMLFEGENPYTEEMGAYIREEMGSQGRHTFLYPAFIAFTIRI